MNIVGLGKAGCAIVDKFAQYPQYKIFKIDVDVQGPNSYNIEKQNTPEEYEANCPDLTSFFGDIQGETWVVIGGAGYISGMSLSLMEQIGECDINVLYIKPEISLLSYNKTLQERLVYMILQEYARSGVLKCLYIVSNPVIEEILGEVPIIGYWDKLNDIIVSTIHMINVFKNSLPVMGRLEEPGTTYRIGTFGLFDEEKSEEKMFFSLDNTRELCYIYSINDKRLKSEGTLFKRITSQIKQKSKQENLTVSYGIYPTTYDQDYTYCLAYTPVIQQ